MPKELQQVLNHEFAGMAFPALILGALAFIVYFIKWWLARNKPQDEQARFVFNMALALALIIITSIVCYFGRGGVWLEIAFDSTVKFLVDSALYISIGAVCAFIIGTCIYFVIQTMKWIIERHGSQNASSVASRRLSKMRRVRIPRPRRPERRSRTRGQAAQPTPDPTQTYPSGSRR